ncbi:MAG: hypothetical protein WC391_08370, partial [Methanoregula sp.]
KTFLCTGSIPAHRQPWEAIFVQIQIIVLYRQVATRYLMPGVHCSLAGQNGRNGKTINSLCRCNDDTEDLPW